jgi:adenylate cyclase
MQELSAYIPEDRRHAMARGEALPDRATGSALFADLSGFTPMTEALSRAYGPHRGAEELTRQLGLVFGELIDRVAAYGGSVIGFSGDAITCWFEGDDDGLRATAASLTMQRAMERFATIPVAGGDVASLRVKTAVAVGPVRRFLVGDPDIQVIDAVAGKVLDLLADAERVAESGDVVVTESVAAPGAPVVVREWREGAVSGGRFAVIGGLAREVRELPWPDPAPNALSEPELGSWVLPGVYERLRQGLGSFLADFRPAAALFFSFRGIDYDDDAAAGDKLDRFVRWVQGRISAYEGSLIQLTIGDKGSSYLYASFGAPLAHDDDAARAVAVALEIQALAPGLDYVRDLHIGITYGQMYAGAYGSATRRTYGVLGAKTNLAARLMAKAAPGQILCDEEVARRAARSFGFTALGSVQVKGKQEPVPIFSPQARLAWAHAPHDASEDGALVGRRHDLAAFGGVLDSVTAGAGRVSFLEGEAGIGKTRLVRAAAQLARERGAAVLLGGGQSGAQGTPYRVWRDVFGQLFALADGLGATEHQTRVAEATAAAVPHLQSLLPLLEDVLSLGLEENAATAALEPAARQEALTEILVGLLRHAAEQAPLVVVLEDAHWLDSLSWELAERVARALLGESARLWLLVVHRPLEEHHIGARAAGALRELPQSGTLQLGPLDTDELVALVAARLGIAPAEVPSEVADEMRERANGNPFIAEELLQTLQDQQLISVETVEGEARLRVSSDLARGLFTLPDTVQGLILSRLDRLPADRQLVLKVASVIGRLFAMTPLRDTLGRLGWAQRALKPSLLRELTRRGFVVPEALEPELAYLFRHVITHEIVYQTLLFAQRRQVHQALAEWYERSVADAERELAPVLAHHWSQAAEGTDDDSVVEKAVRYLKAAGRQALQLGAFPEAAANYERGLSLLADAQRWSLPRASLLVDLSRVLERTGDYAIAMAHLIDALALARSVGHAETTARALIELGRIEQQQGDLPEAERFLEEALAVLEGGPDRSELARVWESLGLLSAYQGHAARAIERLEAAYDHHDGLGNSEGALNVLNNLGIVAYLGADFAAARGYFERALAIARERGDREGIGMLLGNLGQVSENLAAYDEAVVYLSEALEIARELEARPRICDTMVNLAYVSVAMDRDDEAAVGFRTALEGALSIGALPVALTALCGFALLDRRAGDLRRAARLLGFVVAHPAYHPEAALRADPLLAQLRDLLPPAELSAIMAEGGATTIRDVAGALVEGAEQSSDRHRGAPPTVGW